MVIEDLWYKNTIIYNIDLETFMDAGGDGMGDFEGLMRRLNYVQSLGIQDIHCCNQRAHRPDRSGRGRPR